MADDLDLGGQAVVGNIVWWKEGGVNFYPANEPFSVDRSCKTDPVVTLTQAMEERNYWIKRHASALSACVQAEHERDDAEARLAKAVAGLEPFAKAAIEANRQTGTNETSETTALCRAARGETAWADYERARQILKAGEGE